MINFSKKISIGWLFLTLLITIGIVFLIYYLPAKEVKNINNYSITIDSASSMDDVAFQYGSWPQLGDVNFFNNVLKQFKETKAALRDMSAKDSKRNESALKSKQLSHSNHTQPNYRPSLPEKVIKTVSLNESGYHANFPIKRSLEIPIIPIKSVVLNDEDSSEEEIDQVDFEADRKGESNNDQNAITTIPNSAEVNQIASGSKDTTPEVDEPIVFPVSE